MLTSKGKNFGVFVLLIAILLTYTASVNAKGGGRGGGHGGRSSSGSRTSLFSSSSRSRYSGHTSHGSGRSWWGGSRGRSPSTSPSPLLVAVLLLSIVSLNAAITAKSEPAVRS